MDLIQVFNKILIVFIQKNRVHRIEATGNGPAIRLAVSREDVDHIYTGDIKKL